MPTIKEKLYFNFDGVWSNDFNIVHINTDGGMFSETFVANREIVETQMRGNKKPIFHGIEESPLEFEMTIAFEKRWTDEEIDNVLKWLFVDHYKPLYFEGAENKIYRCMPVNDSQIVHNGLKEGYITLSMRCDSSNIYSQTITTNPVNITETSIITINNDGHESIYPEISIIKNGSKGHISIENLNDLSSGIFEIRDIELGEDIYIDCEKEIIETDIIGVYRYDNIIGNFTRLLKGENRLKIDGNCTIQFRYKNKYKF
ncbi:hypothetical protein PQE75_gp219 [Bacillus phage vB_BcoS-136]|uniref:Phage tail protein n=1 Tax=Bacillus phage vB_BcoS-136 TaxID=2419619 RepID=A0A3G3BVU6_9CAUD|nr:hypothetical protein PQE75_gp219 [Bacillus phage vB_BcoS-136]AYP68260.1 hypothetical protein vBBcoS136_00145 [Bacillus phage vB_BcoS-136]